MQFLHAAPRHRAYSGRMKRSASMGAVALTVFTIFAGTGCASPQVCPAIGWGNTLTIEVVDSAEVDQLELCYDDHCLFDDELPPGSPLSGLGWEQLDESTWQFSFVTNPPHELDIRLFDESGEMISEASETLDWRIADYPYGEDCGGPAIAELQVSV